MNTEGPNPYQLSIQNILLSHYTSWAPNNTFRNGDIIAEFIICFNSDSWILPHFLISLLASCTCDYIPPSPASSRPVLMQGDIAEQQLWPDKLFMLHYLWLQSLTQMSVFLGFIEDAGLETFCLGVKAVWINEITDELHKSWDKLLVSQGSALYVSSDKSFMMEADLICHSRCTMPLRRATGGPPARPDADLDTSARGTAVTVAQSSR